MRLSKVKEQLKARGQLDDRQLFSYATAAGTIRGESYQNLVGAAFLSGTLILLQAKTDGTVGEILAVIPQESVTGFQQKNRFLYPYTEITWPEGRLRFYNYDKKIWKQGIAALGLEQNG